MHHHMHGKPLMFSDCHGCNIIITSRNTLSDAKYIKAQGQFITKGNLSRGQRFDLVFEGTGIVKFKAFPRKSLAVDWVRSKQPLPGGCSRVKLNGLAKYRVSVPHPGRCVLVESLQTSRRETFTFQAGPTTTLSFDIEYGDVTVYLDVAPSLITFDTFCCSRHIEITKSHQRSTACLRHYNPSSLCCLEDTSLTPGDIFRLEVENSADRLDAGSYIRICVAKQLNPYENNDQTCCCGSPTHPSVKARRRLIAHNSYEVFIVQILPDGMVLSRLKSRKLEQLEFPVGNKTLWFEMHKVSLRVWQIGRNLEFYGRTKRRRILLKHSMLDLDNSFITFDQDPDDSPPSEPAPPPPPPPRLPPRKPQTYQNSPDTAVQRIRSRHPNSPRRLGNCNDAFVSHASLSSPCESHQSTLERRSSSCVSFHNIGSLDSHNSDTLCKCIPTPSLSAAKSTSKQDLLYGDVDSASLASSGSNIIQADVSQKEKTKTARQNLCYKQPVKILEESQFSPWTQFTLESNATVHVSNTNADCQLHINSGQELSSKVCRQIYHDIKQCKTMRTHSSTNVCRQVHHDHKKCKAIHALSSTNTNLQQRRSPHQIFQTKEDLSCVNRNRMCEIWLANTQNCHGVSLFQEDEDVGSASEHYRLYGECQERGVSGSASVEDSAKCDHKIYGDLSPRLDGSEVDTSSVWLKNLDDDPESVQHNLEIYFLPVQGELKCHSVNTLSASRNTQYGSNCNLMESENGFKPNKANATNNSDFVNPDSRVKTRPEPKSSLSLSGSITSEVGHDDDETTLKKTIFASQSTLDDCDSMLMGSETCAKSVNSGGFLVGKGDLYDETEHSNASSDEITHLKRLVGQDSADITRTGRDLRELGLSDKASSILQPKPCTPQPASQYCLAAPLDSTSSTKPVASFINHLPESNGSPAILESWDLSGNNSDSDGEDSCGTVTKLFQNDILATTRSNRVNELSEEEDEVVCLRNHWRHSRRNITESIISNCGVASLSSGPTIKLPSGLAPVKRTETLIRNLDMSPLNKNCK